MSAAAAVAPSVEKAKRRIFMPLIISLLVVLGVFGGGGYVGSSQAIGNKPEWRKMVYTPAQFNLTSEVASFRATDGIPLKAWWLPAQPSTHPAITFSQNLAEGSVRPPKDPPRINVVLAHGRDMNRSGMLPRAAFLVRNGYNVLDVDLRDHGESGGNYITPGYREALDILGGVDYIRSRGESGPIVVLGYSYGGVAALHSAAQCSDVAAVIADSAFITPDDVLRNVSHKKGIPLKFKIGIWFARLPLLDRSVDLFFRLRTGVKLDRNKASGIAAARRIHGQPILFISGDQDWLAPTENARIMYEAAPTMHKDFFVVPGADHNTTYSMARPFYEEKVLGFLAQNVEPRSVAQQVCHPEED